MEAERNLSIERVYETYVVSFYNDEVHTTVTSDCDTVARWINEIEHPNLYIVGFDIQCRYCYLDDFVSTVQLCVGSRCLIYQLEYVDYDYPDVLLNFLAKEYTFVGWVIDHSLTKLEMEHELHIPRAMVVDLMNLINWYLGGWMDSWEYDDEWAELAEIMVEKELEDLPEDLIILRWDLQRLTPRQVKHLSVDAFMAFEMGRVLNARQYRLIRDT